MSVDLLQDELIRFAPTAEANPDAELREFQGLSDVVPRIPEPSPSPMGPCALCNAHMAVARCVHCERPVCRQDLWTMLGLCKSCASEQEMRSAREGAGRPRPDLGIKWIED